MGKSDLPAVLDLENELFPEDAWSEAMFRSELASQPSTRYYVVAVEDGGDEGGGAIVGYAGLLASRYEADVQTIGVRAGRRGRGVGAALLGALLDEAARRGCTDVFLEVRADNPRAQRLYERFGFGPVRVRRGYYQPAGVDAIVMKLSGLHREVGTGG